MQGLAAFLFEIATTIDDNYLDPLIHWKVKNGHIPILSFFQ